MTVLVLKKKLIISAVLTSVLIFLAFLFPFTTKAVSFKNVKTVALDAGHGGADGGVSGAKSGVKESDLNLQMSKIVGEYLEGAGYRVVYTRKNKQGLYSGLFKKREDMDRRVDIINRSNPSVAVSLHMNYYSSASRRGAQVFFDKSSQKSEAFALTVQDFLNRSFNLPDINRSFPALSAEKYLFWKVSSPIIIVECGFLSNPIDESNLLSSSYRMELGYTIFQGIVAYLSGN